jgi:hypothetical protein
MGNMTIPRFSEWIKDARGFHTEELYARNLGIGVSVAEGQRTVDIMKEYGVTRNIVERVGAKFSRLQDKWMFVRDNWGARMPVEVLINTRIINCLRNEGVRYLDEVVRHSAEYWERSPNMGAGSIAEMYRQLAKYGIKPHPSKIRPTTECPTCGRKFWVSVFPPDTKAR